MVAEFRLCCQLVSIRGSLKTMSVLDVLDWLDRRRPNGELLVQRGTLIRRLETVNGLVTRASGSYPTEQLGRILVGSGAVSEDDLAASLSEAGTGLSLGKRLIRAGRIDEEALRLALELKIGESVYELLSWSEGNFAFEPAQRTRESEVEMGVPIRDLLRQGEARARDWRAARELVPDDDARFVVADPTALALGRMVEDVIRGLTVREIILEQKVLPWTVVRQLADLIRKGKIKLDIRLSPLEAMESGPSPDALLRVAEARAREGNHVAALGLAKAAQTAALGDEGVSTRVRAFERVVLAELARVYLTRWRVPRTLRPPEEVDCLSSEEKYLLGRVDGRWDLMTLMRGTTLREVEALVTLQKLATKGLISL
jgi:hypothetical protein